MRLKLKAKRRSLQRELKHQVDMKLLGEKEAEEFGKVLKEELGSGLIGGVEEAWSTFKRVVKPF